MPASAKKEIGKSIRNVFGKASFSKAAFLGILFAGGALTIGSTIIYVLWSIAENIPANVSAPYGFAMLIGGSVATSAAAIKTYEYLKLKRL